MFSSIWLPPRLNCVDCELDEQSYFTRSKVGEATNMTGSTLSNQTCKGFVTVQREEPEASEGREVTLHDEHITQLSQQAANHKSEIELLRNLTNLSIGLNTPLPEEWTNTPVPHLFHLLTHLPLNTFHQILHFTIPIQLPPTCLLKRNKPTQQPLPHCMFPNLH